MNNNKLILIYLLSFCSIIFSQDNSIKIENEKSIFELSTPFLQHANAVYETQGFSFVYGYPGFFGQYGQSNLYYTTTSGHSYFGGLGMGMEYLMVGTNLNIKKFESSNLYLNFNYGIAAESGPSQLGSLGLSFLTGDELTSFEWSFDVYFHQGVSDNFLFTIDTPNLRGIMTSINIRIKLSQNFSFNYGFGISFVQYRYMKRLYEEYYYVTKYQELNDLEHGYGINPAWDSKFIIPFGVLLSYHF